MDKAKFDVLKERLNAANDKLLQAKERSERIKEANSQISKTLNRAIKN